jgi:DNA-binding transcriptional LysR family regulator
MDDCAMKTLDIEAVQAFVLTADLKSFTRAAEAMDTTQSAVSLKIKKLEDSLGRRLLERTPRQVRLSADGTAFLEPARELVAAHQGAVGAFGVGQRRLVIGVSHHVVGADLPMLLRRMSEAEPGLVLEIRVAASRDVLDAFDRGQLDAAVALQHDSRRLDGETLLSESFGWISSTIRRNRCGSRRRPSRAACAAWPSARWTKPASHGRKYSSAAAWRRSARQCPPGWPSPRSGIAWRPSGPSTWACDTGCRPCRRATWCSTRT